MVKTNMKSMRSLNTVRPAWLALIAACWLLGCAAPASLHAQEVAEEDPPAEQTGEDDEVEGPAPAVKPKPWLITPTLSADPKLGANVGGLIAYLKKLDAESTPSMAGLSVSYSGTDSMTGALFSQLYWKADTRRLSLLAAGAEINNEYDDFLGTGQTVQTQDNVQTFGFRYLHQLRPGGWFAGLQGISTNLPTWRFSRNSCWAATISVRGNVFATCGRISPRSMYPTRFGNTSSSHAVQPMRRTSRR